MTARTRFVCAFAAITAAASLHAAELTLTIDANHVLHRLSPWLTAACIEDVNHEIYGGLDSQMLFGESFAEPARQLPLQGCRTFGGRWVVAPDGTLEGTRTFVDALERLAEGARHRVVVFELNAGNHTQRRALANALAIQAFQRDGRVPVVASANGLQPDGQNDNGWDQGLLFLNPSRVWLQPPGYVTQLISRHHQPLVVACESPGGGLDACATRSEDGRTLVLQVVNARADDVTIPLRITGFAVGKRDAEVWTLAGPLDARNGADTPEVIRPVATRWRPGLVDGTTTLTLPAHSFSVLRLRGTTGQ